MTGSSRVEHMRAKHKPGGCTKLEHHISKIFQFSIHGDFAVFRKLSDFGSIWVHVLWTVKHEEAQDTTGCLIDTVDTGLNTLKLQGLESACLANR